ncbi:MAG: MBOAT family O-acyltransferase [Butyribacter sp.]|nr:MBOAT family protein [bacterium]MDY3853671.1 MBOAT family O-acyltransferase [Butyribacter sp.]
MFTSYEFIAFILVLFLVYYIIPKKFQWILLLAANFMFYYSAGTFYPVFILVTSFSVYITGRILGGLDKKLDVYVEDVKMGKIPKPTREEKKAYKKKINQKKKHWMLLCLFLNLGILAVLKYTNFAIDNVNVLLDAAGKNSLPYADLILPMGISFYTFQAVGYLLDVYWNKCEVQTNFFRFTLFVSFFPQLMQGPISRYGDLSKTLYSKHNFDWKQVRFGLERILWGYFKKLVIADRMSVAVVMLTEDPEYYTGAFVILEMLFYAIQLYGDFTGGIDITIGIAQVLGIHLEENFIRPFFSKNIAEYWRRWHITMGTWFRDYVFYPCSLSRPLKSITTFCKKHFGMQAARRVAVYISTILVWLATGIWHGAAWHFVVWGLANGIIILISEELAPLYQKFHERFPKLVATWGYRAFQVIRTFSLMCCIRLFDNYGSVRVTMRQYLNMVVKFDIHDITKQELLGLGLSMQDYIIVAVGVLLMFFVSLFGRQGSVREKISKKPYLIRYAIFVMLFFAVLLLGTYGVGFDAQQFIYNQF